MIILYFYAFLNNQQPRQGVLLNIFQLDKPEQKKQVHNKIHGRSSFNNTNNHTKQTLNLYVAW
jgi:hypothetical protein